LSTHALADLTGVWNCNDGGKYYIQQVGTVLWWLGELQTTDPKWCNVAKGTINTNANTILLDWSDVPKGKTGNHGTLGLKIISDYELRQFSVTGDFVGSSWTR
jgi:hypothetical protein